jgi:hypothetical protein
VGAVWIERELISWGKCEQGFRRMAARNKPAGIRSLVYGMSKGKAGIEGLSVSGCSQASITCRVGSLEVLIEPQEC